MFNAIKRHALDYRFQKGNTIKQIGKDTNVYVDGLQKPNKFSNGFPWISIKGESKEKILCAYNRVCEVANEANRRIPLHKNERVLYQQQEVAKVSEKKELEEVEVEIKLDKEGNEVYVDKVGNVYDSEGRVVGYMRGKVVYQRIDCSE